MVFKKIIFQNRYVELKTREKTILKFHFDYLHPSLSNNIDCPAYPGHDAIKIVLQKSY